MKPVNETLFRRMRRMRGFSLAEAAIVLAIVGVLLGAVVVPSKGFRDADIYKQEQRNLERARSALLGYALRHRTVPVTVVATDAAGRFPREFALGVRPHLPCPDITGDGLEDRSAFDVAGARYTGARRITVGADASINQIMLDGSCGASRGALPWRTLGLPPADHWGNVYAYHADAVFADALAGFNQNSAIDQADPRSQVAGSPPRHLARRGVTLTIALADGAASETRAHPAAVCDGDQDCRPGLSLRLAAGAQAAGPYAVLFRDFAQHDVVEGLPFVVATQGKNGAGAARFDSAAGDFECRAPVGDPSVMVSLSIIGREAYNYPHLRRALPSTQCANIFGPGGVTLEAGLFMTQPRTEEFDDSLLWMTQDELLAAMARGGALPAPDLPALRSY